MVAWNELIALFIQVYEASSSLTTLIVNILLSSSVVDGVGCFQLTPGARNLFMQGPQVALEALFVADGLADGVLELDITLEADRGDGVAAVGRREDLQDLRNVAGFECAVDVDEPRRLVRRDQWRKDAIREAVAPRQR